MLAVFQIMVLQLVLLFLLSPEMVESREQSVKIQGIFRCGEEIPQNATIELWDEDDPLRNFFHQYFIQENSMNKFLLMKKYNLKYDSSAVTYLLTYITITFNIIL